MLKKKKITEKLVIGRLDKIDLPGLELFDIPCKIDTGAQTSAIHCHQVKIIEKEGKEWITFMVLDPSHPEYNGMVFKTDDFQERKIKNSFGQSEFRFVIKTRIVLFGKSFITEVTLADRENMRYPVLLGRKLLKRNFLVDVSKVDLSYQKKEKSNS